MTWGGVRGTTDLLDVGFDAPFGRRRRGGGLDDGELLRGNSKVHGNRFLFPDWKGFWAANGREWMGMGNDGFMIVSYRFVLYNERRLQKEGARVPSDVRTVIELRQVFYEVSPYYVMVDYPPVENGPAARMVMAGFDVDVFGLKASDEAQPSVDYELLHSTLQEVRAKVAPRTTDACYLEVIAYDSTVYFDAKHKFREETLLRIRITHQRGLDRPANKAEESALHNLEMELRQLGIRSLKGAM